MSYVPQNEAEIMYNLFLFYFIFLGITQCVFGLLFCFLFDRTTSVPNGAWIRAPSSQLLMSKVEEIEDLGLC